MKRLILIINLIIINSIQVFCKDEIIEISFHFFPAFLSESVFDFKFEEPNGSLELNILDPFFLNFDSKFDTVSNDKFLIQPTKKEFIKFKDEIGEISFNNSLGKPFQGHDGIGVKIIKRFKSGKSENLTFDSPSNRQSHPFEYQLLDKFFNVIESINFERKKKICLYTQELRRYFHDYPLKIRRLQSSPFEYRIWSGIYKDDIEEFRKFLEGLSSSQPIILDLSFYGHIDKRACRYLKRANRKKQIYFLHQNKYYNPPKKIKYDRFFKSKKEIIEFLKNKVNI